MEKHKGDTYYLGGGGGCFHKYALKLHMSMLTLKILLLKPNSKSCFQQNKYWHVHDVYKRKLIVKTSLIGNYL